MTDLINDPAAPARAAPAESRPDGEYFDGTIAAALISCGIACLVFGSAVLLAEHVPSMEKEFTLSESVGPLSGKAVAAVIAYVVAWSHLHLALRHREIRTRTILLITAPMIAVGFLLTFPPIYQHLWI